MNAYHKPDGGAGSLQAGKDCKSIASNLSSLYREVRCLLENFNMFVFHNGKSSDSCIRAQSHAPTDPFVLHAAIRVHLAAQGRPHQPLP